jgi:hypothetical protein
MAAHPQKAQKFGPGMSDRSRPQIVVYALADAHAALEAAAGQNMAITLVSPPGAAGFAGPGWFREVVAQARDAVPGVAFDSVLDCAGEAGLALAAIREGVEAICFDGPSDTRAKIDDIAAQAGCALVEIDYERALDLDQCTDAAAACRDWLSLKLAKN